jgi:hypothetical protein
MICLPFQALSSQGKNEQTKLADEKVVLPLRCQIPDATLFDSDLCIVDCGTGSSKANLSCTTEIIVSIRV